MTITSRPPSAGAPEPVTRNAVDAAGTGAPAPAPGVAPRGLTRRVPLPEAPEGEITLQAPPALPKSGGGGGATQLMFMLPMMLGMGAMSFTYIGRSGGPLTYVFAALYGSAMLGMVVMSMSRGGMAKKAQVNEERRDYQRYLGGLRQQVRDVEEAQRHALSAQQPDPADLWALIDGPRLWERRRHDPDFGRVRVGAGPQRLATPLKAPQTAPLEDLDPVSSTALRHFIRTYAAVPDLPVAISLKAFALVGLAGPRAEALGLARALVAQIATFHAPSEMKIAFCVSPDRARDWDWAKWLPHAQHAKAVDGAGPVRLIAASLQQLASLLGDDLGERPAFAKRTPSGFDGPHIIVIVDGGATAGDTAIAPAGGRYGVTLVDVTSEASMRPPNPITLDLVLQRSEADASSRTPTLRLGVVGENGIGYLGRPDSMSVSGITALARQLTPRHRVAPMATSTPMSATFGLAGLLGLGDPRDVDVRQTWLPRSARDRLRIPIGIDPDGRPVDLDLKESAEGGMGPHGLVIGATGSGKSELLRTLVTGLAVTHSSDTLNLALIDFKGGATFASLEDLPHVCAVITNLADDLALVDRMADSISGEVVRRQELLRKAGNMASVRDYERAREGGAPLHPLPSLLVIIDEFSELLSARPEFIDLFVMIGRLGRSLGIHLLLASQRLEEGRLRGLDSHLSYRIGLRTFNASESRAVLGVADAAELPPVPGSAFLKVDVSTLLRLKAAYVSGELPPRGLVEDMPETAALAVPFRLEPVELAAQASGTPTVAADNGHPKTWAEEAMAARPGINQPTIMSALVDCMLGAGPPAHQIWLPPLADPPTLDHLLPPLSVDPARGYGTTGWRGNGTLTVPVAIVDKPYEQRRDLLWADFAGAAGHAIVVGAPRSGKSTLLRTTVAALALTHTPAEVQFFIADMGGGGLSSLAGLPHTSGYGLGTDGERVRRIVAEVTGLLARREKAFGAHGLDGIAAYRAMRARLTAEGATMAQHAAIDGEGRPFGDVFLIVDDWATLRSDHEQLEEQITRIAARGLGFGIHVIVSSTRWMSVRAALRDAIGTRFELRQGDPADSVIDRRTAMTVPSDRPGRGITQDKLHFLTGLPRVDGDRRTGTLPSGAADLNSRLTQAWTGPKAPPVRLLPREFPATALPRVPLGANGRPTGVPLGISEHDLQTVQLDFGTDPHFLAFGDVESGKTSLLRQIVAGIAELYTVDEAAVIVADYRRGLLDSVPESHLLGYAGSEPVLSGFLDEVVQAMRMRIPGPDVTPAQLRTRSWWDGPELFVVLDDYELIASSARNPLHQLLEFLPQSRDIGLHIVMTRGAGGAGRGLFEPVVQRLRELGTPGLIMSGQKDEGVLLGDQKAQPLPPGRGMLVHRRLGTQLVQLPWRPPADELG